MTKPLFRNTTNIKSAFLAAAYFVQNKTRSAVRVGNDIIKKNILLQDFYYLLASRNLTEEYGLPADINLRRYRQNIGNPQKFLEDLAKGYHEGDAEVIRLINTKIILEPTPEKPEQQTEKQVQEKKPEQKSHLEERSILTEEKVPEPSPAAKETQAPEETPTPVAPTIPLPEKIETPGFVKDILSRSQIFIKRFTSRYLSFTQVSSLVTGLMGAVVGAGSASTFGVAAPIGALIGGGVGLATPTLVQTFFKSGGGEMVLNAGKGGLNTTEGLLTNLSRLDSFTGKFTVFNRTGLIIIIALILGLTFFISGIGGPATNLEASPLPSRSPRIIGVNIFNLADKTRENPQRVDRMLSYLSNSCGTNTIRIWGTGSAQDLKTTLDLGVSHGIKFIIPLADYPNRPNTLFNFGKDILPTSWYTNDYKGLYFQHVTDTVKALKDHPSVYAWELANEPHCNGDIACIEPYYNWVKNTSALIKSIDPTHLVSIGTQANTGVNQGENVDEDQYLNINSLPNIDLLTGHYYNGDITGNSDPNEFKKQKDFILKDLGVAKKLNKPFYIGEAGFVCGVGSPSNCTQASSNNESARAQQVKSEITEFFNVGASGYLLWQYSDRKNDDIENDFFSFFEGDPICGVLKEFSQKEVPTTSAPPASAEFQVLHNEILKKFNINFDKSFTYDYLKWAWEKLWGASNTRFLNLVNPNNVVISIVRDDTRVSGQLDCNRITMRGKYPDTGLSYSEPLFKVAFIHELSHIIENCRPDSISKKSQLDQIIKQEGYLTNYSQYADRCPKTIDTNKLNEDYAETVAYFLNLKFAEQSYGVGGLCEPSEFNNPYDRNKPFHKQFVQDLLL